MIAIVEEDTEKKIKVDRTAESSEHQFWEWQSLGQEKQMSFLMGDRMAPPWDFWSFLL